MYTGTLNMVQKIGLDMSVLLLTFSSVKKALSILYDEERIKKEKK